MADRPIARAALPGCTVDMGFPEARPERGHRGRPVPADDPPRQPEPPVKLRRDTRRARSANATDDR